LTCDVLLVFWTQFGYNLHIKQLILINSCCNLAHVLIQCW
jgi:hypothetical protein